MIIENQHDYARHSSWQIRQPAAQSKLREPFDVARAAYYVPAMQSLCYF